MSSKKKILVFVDWYLPGYKAGGQIRSVAAMAGHLKEAYNSPYFNNIRKEFGDYNSFWKSLYHSGYSPLSEKSNYQFQR